MPESGSSSVFLEPSPPTFVETVPSSAAETLADLSPPKVPTCIEVSVDSEALLDVSPSEMAIPTLLKILAATEELSLPTYLEVLVDTEALLDISAPETAVPKLIKVLSNTGIFFDISPSEPVASKLLKTLTATEALLVPTFPDVPSTTAVLLDVSLR